MKLKLFILTLLATLPAFAATVLIAPTEWPGVSSKQEVTITNITGVVLGSTNVWAIPAKKYAPTNSYSGRSNLVSAVVIEGSYRALIGPYSVAFNVPNSTNVYWLSEVATNGATIGSINSIFALRSNATFVGAMPTLNGTNFNTLFAGGGSGTTYTFMPTNLAAGLIVTNGTTVFNGTNLSDLATAAAVNTVSNQSLASSNFHSAALDVQARQVITYTTNNAELISYNSGNSFFNTSFYRVNSNYYTNSTRWLTNRGDSVNQFWVAERLTGGNFNQFSNTALTGTWLTWSNTNVPPTIEYVLNVPVTNTVYGPYFNPTNQDYFGLIFFGGIGFTQTNVTRDAYYARMTADGKILTLGAAVPVKGLTGNVRDPSISKRYNGYRLMGLTTNRFDGAGFGSPAVELKISGGFNDWRTFTNLSFVPTNYSIHPTNMRTWKVSFADDGDKVWLTAGVSTNNGVSFAQWIRTTPKASFPFGGFSEPVMVNQSGYSNIVDGTLLWCKTNMVLCAVDAAANTTIQFGYFQTTNPASPFTWTLTGDHSGWLSGFEAPTFTEYTTTEGTTVTVLSAYKHMDAYTAADGYMRKLASITNFNPTATTAWSTLTHAAVNPRAPNGLGYAQNWIPQQPETQEELDQMNALVPPTYPLVGRIPIYPPQDEFTNQYGGSLYGFPSERNASFPISNIMVGVEVPGSGSGYYVKSIAGDVPQLVMAVAELTTNNTVSVTNESLVVGRTNATFGPKVIISGNGVGITNLSTNNSPSLAGSIQGAAASKVDKLNGGATNLSVFTQLTIANTNGLPEFSHTIMPVDSELSFSSAIRATKFYGGDYYGNMFNATNANASTLFGSGTVPGARLTGTSATNLTLVNATISGAVTNTAAVTNSGVQTFSAPITTYGTVTNFGGTLSLGTGTTRISGSATTVTITPANSDEVAVTANGLFVLDGDSYLGTSTAAGNVLFRGYAGATCFVRSNLVTYSATATNGYYFPANSITVATVAAGMTNGASWMGMMSNALQAAWMSNNVVTWKIIAP